MAHIHQLGAAVCDKEEKNRSFTVCHAFMSLSFSRVHKATQVMNAQADALSILDFGIESKSVRAFFIFKKKSEFTQLSASAFRLFNGINIFQSILYSHLKPTRTKAICTLKNVNNIQDCAVRSALETRCFLFQ